MSEKNKLHIIRPVNYKWVVTCVVALLTWQTYKVVEILLSEGQGESTQLFVYLLVLGLAFALKESAFKPIRLTDHYCVVKTVMAKETITYADVEQMELVTRTRERRKTFDLKIMSETPVFIKDIGVYHKKDIESLIQTIGGGSSMSATDVDALIESLYQVRFAKQ